MASRFRYHAPNPPPWFVGRTRELATIDALLERGPLAFLSGAAGAGKSACALEHIARRGTDAQDHTIYVSVPRDEPVEQVLATLVSAIGGASARPGDIEDLAERAVEAAEAHGSSVVVDDCDHTDVEELGELLVRVRSFARRSKWLALGRTPPPQPELLDVIVRIDRLDDASLRELARRYAPHLGADEIERAVRAAAGSPFFLRGTLGPPAAQSAEPLASLDRDARGALALIAELTTDAPLHLVRSHVAAETLDALARAGLIEAHGGRVRCHEAVRAHLAGEAEPQAVVAFARTLADEGDAEAAAEALRLFTANGASDDLVRLARERGEDMIARGLAPRLWLTLRDDVTPELRALRLRCATVLGNPTALSALEPVKPGGGLDAARAAFLRGDLDGALAAASQIEPSDDVESPLAPLLLARCHLQRGDVDAAARALGSDETLHRGMSALGVRATIAAQRGDGAGVARAAREAAGYLRERRPDASFTTLLAHCEIAEALRTTGAWDDALRWIERAPTLQERESTRSFVGRLALLVAARIAIERGDLARAEAIASSLLPYVRGPSILRPAVHEIRAAVDFESGRAVGLNDRLAMIAAEATAIDASCAARVSLLQARFRTEQGVASVAPLASDTIDEGGRRRAPLELVALSRSAVANGHPAFALELAREAEARALRREMGLARCEAIRARLDALAVLGLHDERVAAAEALHGAALEIGAGRLVREAEAHAASDDPAVLERIANAPEPLTANRRARALLGGTPPLDAVDALFVSSIRRATEHAVETIGGPTATWSVGWGLDAASQRAWLPDGRWIDMSGRSTQWALLWYLAERGGAASKEELTIGVWKERSYHPGRHDSRIHVVVRKLRQDLEDDPSSPRRLLTTEDGYALGLPIRRRVRINSAAAVG